MLLFLFGSKDGLIREILARARADELALLERVAVEAGGRPRGWPWSPSDCGAGSPRTSIGRC
ncbi:hypothetical protein ACFSVJ_02745 [Prauserella oleivorans]